MERVGELVPCASGVGRFLTVNVGRHLCCLCQERPVLDVGCGNGVFLKDLYELGYTQLTGVDYSEPAIELCKAHLVDPETKAPIAALIVGSLAALPFSDGAFAVRMCACMCVLIAPSNCT